MSAVGLVISQAATVVQTLVLGRLLGPHEVGVFAAGSVVIGFLSAVAAGRPVAGPHLPQDRRRGRRQHSTDRYLRDGPIGRSCAPGGLAVDRHTVPQFAGRSGRGRDLRTDGASCVYERPGCVDEARISVQATDDHHASDFDHVRGCVDRCSPSRDTARGQWSSGGTHQPPPRSC